MKTDIIVLQRQVHQGQPHSLPSRRYSERPVQESNGQYQQAPVLELHHAASRPMDDIAARSLKEN